MDVSFNELEARVKKAARGAGLPWGLAEDFAKAIVAVAQKDHISGTWVVDFLLHPRACDWLKELTYELDMHRSPKPRPANVPAQMNPVWEGFEIRYLQLSGGKPYPPRLRATIDSELWLKLEKLEFQTYAPESDESRLKGAGAGVNDND